MKLQECQFNHCSGEINLHQKETIFPGLFINQPFLLNHIFRNEKAKKIFHSFENQHFNFINVGFFLLFESDINKQKI
jgi:hypothetical protein